MKRRILLATWAPFIGGAEIAIERLALGLEEVGHEILMVVGTKGEAFERFRKAGLNCEFIPQSFTSKLGWFKHWRSVKSLRSAIERFCPDLIHSNDLPTHQLVSHASRKLGIPRICHHRFVFGGEAIDWMNKYGAERHVFVSQALQDELVGASTTIDPAIADVVYDGLPLPPMPTSAEKESARQRLGLPSDATIVLFAGQIIERKGVQDLIRAWVQLPAEKRADAKLYIVGDDLQNSGKYRRTMMELAREIDCECQFMGFRKDVNDWLIASDLAIVPSHVEPLGNATLEAMSYGVPVVGCSVGGIPEMIVSGETGILVPHKDPLRLATAIGEQLADANLRKQLSMASRQRCEAMFSLSHHVDAMLQQYDLVLRA